MKDLESLLRKSEKAVFSLRELYRSAGYEPYCMSKFEEYDLYAENKEFLVSDNVITFTDTDGKLMALKPDVTLSIIKNSRDVPDVTRKVYYHENVYRVKKGTGTFGEIMQAGVECFGCVTEEDVTEVLTLALESLGTLAPGGVLALSNLDLTEELIRKTTVPAGKKAELLTAISEKNLPAVRALTGEGDDAKRLCDLVSLHGAPADVLPKLVNLFPGDSAARESFCRVLKSLAAHPLGESVTVDFSVTDDMQYYNGIVFKGYLRGIPVAVLSGGQYDRLMRKFGRTSRAIGFAVYTDELERSRDAEETVPADDGYLNIALPKGRLGEKVYAMLASAGFECPSILEPNRKLIFENPERGVRYFWVKPSDVAIYVERGAADLGIAGKDILLEYRPDVLELLDLGIGKCRMAVAGPVGFTDDKARTLRVATKFSRIAQEYYKSQGRDIDIIHLNGSIEIAPILGLSDVIVDIVETGATLRENNLAVVETVVPISARLIANKSAYKFKSGKMERLVAGLSALTEASE